MAENLLRVAQNTNPSRFEELAGVLASVVAYYRDHDRLDKLQHDFEHLYRRALSQPPCFTEVNELTGQCLNAGDHMAGRAVLVQREMDICSEGVMDGQGLQLRCGSL
jgi:hypothetical protein